MLHRRRTRIGITAVLLIYVCLAAACSGVTPTTQVLPDPGTPPPPTTQATRGVTLYPTYTPRSTSTPVPPTPSPLAVCPKKSDAGFLFPTSMTKTEFYRIEYLIAEYLSHTGSIEGLDTGLSLITVVDEGGYEYGVNAQVQSGDVTGDGLPEVLVAVEGTDSLLYILRCSDSKYERIYRYLSERPNVGMTDMKVRVIQDLDLDSVPEVGYSFNEYLGPMGVNMASIFRIMRWNGDTFEYLIKAPDRDQFYLHFAAVESFYPNTATIWNGDGNFTDTDGDGMVELVLSSGQGILIPYGSSIAEMGPHRMHTDTWAWDGEFFTLRDSKPEAPYYRFQAVQDGDDALLSGRYDDAQALYKQAIFDNDLQGWNKKLIISWFYLYEGTPEPPPDAAEWPRLAAYSRFRLVLVHILKGDLDSARVVYDTLQKDFTENVPGYPYAQLAKVFWDEYLRTSEMASACRLAVQYADQNSEAILTPLGSDMYGPINRDYSAQDMCPFGD